MSIYLHQLDRLCLSSKDLLIGRRKNALIYFRSAKDFDMCAHLATSGVKLREMKNGKNYRAESY